MSEQVWNIDASHTVVEFSVRHMMISRVKGRFGEVSGQLVGDAENLADAKLEVKVDLTKVDTRNEERDNHLRSADFFDVEKFPEMVFVSREARKVGDDAFEVDGDLTIRGVTRPITLKARFEGAAQDPWGNQRVGYSAEAKVNRKDFGLEWNVALEAGGFLVGDEVEISIEVELVKAN